MSFEPTEFLLGVATGGITAIYPWIKFLVERRDKNAERAAKLRAEEKTTRAEAALAAADSRADAPFFIPSVARENLFMSGGSQGWHVMNGNVLSVFQDTVAVGIPAGTPVVLPLANRGEKPRWVGFKINGVKIPHVEYTDGTEELWGILEYPFDPAANGDGQIVEVFFESGKGVQRVHRYGMQHGSRRFGRLDPAPSPDGWG
ncbi:MAG: hypothetical protein ACREH8_08060 [Opitutaceae bacterium]